MEELERAINLLIAKVHLLEEENRDLTDRLNDAREDSIKDRAELAELRQLVRKLRLADALSATDKAGARRYIDSIITRIDDTLELMKEV